MAYYVVDSQPGQQFPFRSVGEADAVQWLNRVNWQSCISDDNIKRHVTEICPGKKSLLAQECDSPPELGPGDEALLICRDQDDHQDTRRPYGQKPKHLALWSYRVLSA